MKLVVHGYGTMGKVLVEEISKFKDIELVGVIDPLQKLGVASLDDITVKPDVIIDFSHPDLLEGLLHYVTKEKVPCLIATTGLSNEQLESIEKASSKIPLIQTGNTSLGINTLLEVVNQVTRALGDSFDIEIIEKHHNKKVDAPSGTAMMFLDEIASVKKDTNNVFGRAGSSKRASEDVTVHAIRGGSIVGEHTILFAGQDETIEIKHQAQSKALFAQGAIKAAYFLSNQEPGLYTMKDVLFK